MKSLSVIIPVYNGARNLRNNVNLLLEFIPRLTHRFQLVIVDDGSTDATGDIAQELAETFPQVNVVFHSCPRGETESIESGREHAHFELVHVLVPGEFNLKFLETLLTHGKLPEISPTAEELNTENQLLERLMKWGMALRDYRDRNREEKTESVDHLSTDQAVNETVNTGAEQLNSELKPKPKFSSVPEKRLQLMSQKDLAR